MGRTVSAPASRASVTPRVGQFMPHLVVPQILCDAARQPKPARVVLIASVFSAERLQRSPQRRYACCVALGEARRQAIEEQVDRPRRSRRRRCGPGGLGRLPHPDGAAEPAGEHRRSERFEIRLARQRGIERLEAFGGLEQQRWGVAAAPAGERDLCAQPLQPRALKLVERAHLRGGEQLGRRIRRGSLELGLSGGERSRSPAGGVGSELGRPLQERGRGRDAAAALCAVGRALELVGHRLVGPRGSVGAMPRPAIGIDLRIGRLGQRTMHALAVSQ